MEFYQKVGSVDVDPVAVEQSGNEIKITQHGKMKAFIGAALQFLNPDGDATAPVRAACRVPRAAGVV